MSNSQDHKQTLSKVSRLIYQIIGEEWISEHQEITMKTSFSSDLELESIELVTLAEKLQAEYQGRVNFAQWLASKELEEIIHLTVGDVVEFIDQCLSSK